MFKKILIANRGEIALRIIRCCRELGIDTVAVYSTADEASLHVELATEAVCIGGPKAADSYLNIRNILSAAMYTGCEAIHPGFGFLSENSEFAALCRECGLVFIGPDAGVIEKMGNKAAARSLMMENHIPVVPGSEGYVTTLEEAEKTAARIGYPVLVKAAAGGGGRGMRKAFCKEELKSAFSSAKAEAKACFGNNDMYMEKLIVNPKHIEFQILADSFGNVIHLGERDCSIQRKNQKLIEESPSKAINKELRKVMGGIAVKAAKAAGYKNAGTIEFVLDQTGDFYFIEMNTRIQVEHPVTEMITGIDLIKEQIRIAAGLPMKYKQEEIRLEGYAMECRINAEDPAKNFRPSPGTVDFLHLPAGYGVRVDTALYNGYTTSPFYDSMMAKVIVHGKSRLEVIRRMRRALEEMVIEGVVTNLDLQHLILYQPDFMRGNYNTGFIEKHLAELLKLHEEVYQCKKSQ